MKDHSMNNGINVPPGPSDPNNFSSENFSFPNPTPTEFIQPAQHNHNNYNNNVPDYKGNTYSQIDHSMYGYQHNHYDSYENYQQNFYHNGQVPPHQHNTQNRDLHQVSASHKGPAHDMSVSGGTNYGWHDHPQNVSYVDPRHQNNYYAEYSAHHYPTHDQVNHNMYPREYHGHNVHASSHPQTHSQFHRGQNLHAPSHQQIQSQTESQFHGQNFHTPPQPQFQQQTQSNIHEQNHHSSSQSQIQTQMKQQTQPQTQTEIQPESNGQNLHAPPQPQMQQQKQTQTSEFRPPTVTIPNPQLQLSPIQNKNPFSVDKLDKTFSSNRIDLSSNEKVHESLDSRTNVRDARVNTISGKDILDSPSNGTNKNKDSEVTGLVSEIGSSKDKVNSSSVVTHNNVNSIDKTTVSSTGEEIIKDPEKSRKSENAMKNSSYEKMNSLENNINLPNDAVKSQKNSRQNLGDVSDNTSAEIIKKDNVMTVDVTKSLENKVRFYVILLGDKLRLMNVNHEFIEVETHLEDTVKEIKMKIQESENIPYSQQCIIFNEVVLGDDRTLSSCTEDEDQSPISNQGQQAKRRKVDTKKAMNPEVSGSEPPIEKSSVISTPPINDNTKVVETQPVPPRKSTKRDRSDSDSSSSPGCLDNEEDEESSLDCDDKTSEKRDPSDDLFLMNSVEHLCYTVVDPKTKLPTKYITVMNCATEDLYDFRVDVRSSLIPNSGYGAFLTFLGTRVLKPEFAEKSAALLSNRFYQQSKTKRELVAEMPDGSKMSVKLDGENLHSKNNVDFYTWHTHTNIKARVKGKDLKVKIKIDDYEDREALKYYFDKGRKLGTRNGIGFLGLHNESDYLQDDTILFSSYNDGCGLIDLGRYGPFRQKDRKTDSEFILKDFIFSSEPSAWNFGVDTHTNVCDITDDLTGEPHHIAKSNIPMYVNEVGHSKTLRHNVLSREWEQDDSVHYILHLSIPMKKGQTVELLTNYGEAYELARERKGYGLKNINDGCKSDYDDESIRLHRTLIERRKMKEFFIPKHITEIAHVFYFMLDKILGPIDESIRKFSSESSSINRESCFTPSDWIARRRMEFVAEIVVDHMRKIDIPRNDQSSTRAVINNMLISFKDVKLINKPLLHSSINSNTVQSNKTILKLMKQEVYDELLYTASELFVRPLDDAIWCKISQSLMKDIVDAIVEYNCTRDGDITRIQNRLVKDILGKASSAVEKMRKAFKDEEVDEDFAFKSSSISQEVVELILDEIDDFRSSVEIRELCHASPFEIPLHFSTIMKEYLEDGCESTQDLKGYKNDIMFSYYERAGEPLVITKVDAFAGVQTKSDSKDVKIDLEWYILWQVVLVVHAFAISCVEWIDEPKSDSDSYSESEPLYSLRKLCKAVGANFSDASMVVSETRNILSAYDIYDGDSVLKRYKLKENTEILTNRVGVDYLSMISRKKQKRKHSFRLSAPSTYVAEKTEIERLILPSSRYYGESESDRNTLSRKKRVKEMVSDDAHKTDRTNDHGAYVSELEMVSDDVHKTDRTNSNDHGAYVSGLERVSDDAHKTDRTNDHGAYVSELEMVSGDIITIV